MQAQPNDYPLASGLSSYLSSVERGSKVDLRSPLYDGRDVSRDSIVRRWDAIFQTHSLPSELDEIEDANRQKIGPFSIRLPYSERKESLYQYFNEPLFRPDNGALDRATARLEQLIEPHKLRPASIEDVFRKSAKSTNWGLPFAQTGARLGNDYLRIARDDLAKNTVTRFPAILGWRGQPTGTETPKQRDVWMYPHSIVLIEVSFQIPLLSRLKQLPGFAAWIDQDAVDLEVTDILRTAKSQGLDVISYDATGYDKSVHRDLIDRVFNCIKLWFQPSYGRLIDQLADIFATIGIVTPEGTLVGRQHNVPSGSGLTNMIDTLVHWLQFYYLEELLGAQNQGRLTSLGDDGIWIMPGLDSEVLEESVAMLGFEANPSKQYISEDSAVYLQRWHSLNYLKGDTAVGVRSTYRTLNGMLSYERLVKGWTGAMDSVRWIMQLENCKHHPAFEDLVEFAVAGDSKYGLGRSVQGGIVGLAKLAGGSKGIASALRIESFPFRDRDPSKLVSFATSQIVLGK